MTKIPRTTQNAMQIAFIAAAWCCEHDGDLS